MKHSSLLSVIYRRLTGIDFEVPSQSPLDPDDRCVSIYRVVIYWNLLIWTELKSLEGNRIVTRSTVINELFTSNTALAGVQVKRRSFGGICKASL